APLASRPSARPTGKGPHGKTPEPRTRHTPAAADPAEGGAYSVLAAVQAAVVVDPVGGGFYVGHCQTQRRQVGHRLPGDHLVACRQVGARPVGALIADPAVAVVDQHDGSASVDGGGGLLVEGSPGEQQADVEQEIGYLG